MPLTCHFNLLSNELNYFLKRSASDFSAKMRGKVPETNEVCYKILMISFKLTSVTFSTLIILTLLLSYLLPTLYNPTLSFFSSHLLSRRHYVRHVRKIIPFFGLKLGSVQNKEPWKIIYKFLLPQIPSPKNFTRDLYLKIKFYSKKSPETRRLPQIFTPKPG